MCILTDTRLVTMIFITMFLPESWSSNNHVLVKVNDPALLTCNKPCSGRVKWMLAKQREILVSECKGATCDEGDGFKNRTRLVQGGPFLYLNSVMYNDKGWYICYCDGLEICKFHLEVVFPNQKRVCVGESVTIPCYANTHKQITDTDIYIQWEKDNKPVVKLQQGKMSYGPGFEGRSFVTASQYKNGDLSLTISKVQQSDGGIYLCRHRHEEPGEPEAVTLSIRKSSECGAVKQSTFPWWGILLVVAASIICLGGLFYILFIRAFRFLNDTRNKRLNVDDENATMIPT